MAWLVLTHSPCEFIHDYAHHSRRKPNSATSTILWVFQFLPCHSLQFGGERWIYVCVLYDGSHVWRKVSQRNMDVVRLWHFGHPDSSVSLCRSHADTLRCCQVALNVRPLEHHDSWSLDSANFKPTTIWWSTSSFGIRYWSSPSTKWLPVEGNYMTAEEGTSLTLQIIKDRVEGSKWVFVSEQAMVVTIWSLKLCMLFIYGRLTYVLFPSTWESLLRANGLQSALH